MNIVQFAGGTFVDSEDFSNRAQVDPAPVVSIEGNASVDGSTADGASENNITFVALDADGQGCATYLEFTSDSGSAILGAETAMTDYDTGQVTISLTDTVGEVVTVSAKQAGGDVVGTAETTFIAVDDGDAGLESFRQGRAGRGRVTTGDWPRNDETEEQREKRLERQERDKDFAKKREDESDEQYRTRLAKDRDAKRPPQSGGRTNPSSPASGSGDKSTLPADIDPSVKVSKSAPAAGSLEGKDTPPATTKPAPKSAS
jgi:hypothetical protein